MFTSIVFGIFHIKEYGKSFFGSIRDFIEERRLIEHIVNEQRNSGKLFELMEKK